MVRHELIADQSRRLSVLTQSPWETAAPLGHHGPPLGPSTYLSIDTLSRLSVDFKMAEPSPAIHATVDLMILDYLVCLCISGIIEAIRQARPTEDIEWSALLVERKHQNFPATDHSY